MPSSWCLFRYALALVILFGAHVQQAAALNGQETCPLMMDKTTMSAWCTARFGGYGGTLTAGAWDHNRQSFSCICNANTNAAIAITRQTLAQQRQQARHRGELGHGRDTRAFTRAGGEPNFVTSFAALQGSEADSFSSSLGSSSSSSSSSSYPSSSSSSSDATPTSPPSHLSSSSSSVPAVVSSDSSDSTVTGTCAWNGVFTRYPDGVQCMATTGLCPSSCSVIPANLCNNQYASSETCTSPSAYVVSYTCLTCNGRNYTISSTSVESCTRYYPTADTCNAQSACSGHGCCMGTSTSTGSTATCTCFNDGTNGYYTGGSCNSCQSGYDRNSANLCLVATNKVQIILASIARTWTMVAPNMAVLFLFVIFSVTRKLNASDRPFDLTGLRRANLSTVQVARRRQQSLFHSKYIPMRPAKSRSFANPHQPQTRGPPAF